MAKSDLLKEAIADARTVKETALANAKIALQEAFAPRLENMLSARLAEELEDEEPIEAAPVDDMPAEDMPADEDGDVNWIDNDLSFSVGGQQFDAQVNNPAGDEEVGAGMAGEFEDDAMPAENPEAEYAEEDDLDLEEIIRELEEDPSMEEPIEEPIEEPMNMVEGGDHGYDGDEEESPEDIDKIIEAILREEEEVVAPEEDATEEELKEVKSELEEAYKTVRQLKSIINEVNLLNAKLLYTNKLFRNFDLNENQKMKVLESFDRAGNTREVKLVFSTMAESFTKPAIKRVVKESYASKPVASTKPESKAILAEGFELANRWKKLAGLK